MSARQIKERRAQMIIALKNQQGVTLLEVMIGMLVFSLGMMMMIPMVVTSIAGNAIADDNDAVMQDVQNVIEAFKADALPPSGMDYEPETHRYVMWWTEPVTTNLEKLNIEIMWEDKQMQFHSRRVSTYVYRRAGGS